VTRKSRSLAARSAALAFAVPEVIARRALRMDRKEFHRMGAEKFFAFGESWNAMLTQAFVENQKLMMSMWVPWFAPRSSPASAMLNVLDKGMAPIQRRASANARRLRKRKA
jgi:hypothetical protein